MRADVFSLSARALKSPAGPAPAAPRAVLPQRKLVQPAPQVLQSNRAPAQMSLFAGPCARR